METQERKADEQIRKEKRRSNIAVPKHYNSMEAK